MVTHGESLIYCLQLQSIGFKPENGLDLQSLSETESCNHATRKHTKAIKEQQRKETLIISSFHMKHEKLKTVSEKSNRVKNRTTV